MSISSNFLFTAPVVCFSTDWGNKIDQMLHLYHISTIDNVCDVFSEHVHKSMCVTLCLAPPCSYWCMGYIADIVHCRCGILQLWVWLRQILCTVRLWWYPQLRHHAHCRRSAGSGQVPHPGGPGKVRRDYQRFSCDPAGSWDTWTGQGLGPDVLWLLCAGSWQVRFLRGVQAHLCRHTGRSMHSLLLCACTIYKYDVLFEPLGPKGSTDLCLVNLQPDTSLHCQPMYTVFITICLLTGS